MQNSLNAHTLPLIDINRKYVAKYTFFPFAIARWEKGNKSCKSHDLKEPNHVTHMTYFLYAT